MPTAQDKESQVERNRDAERTREAELNERAARLEAAEAELDQRRRELEAAAVPPAPAGPDQGPPTHVAVLADGTTIQAWNLNATHHSIPAEKKGSPDRVVPIIGGYAL